MCTGTTWWIITPFVKNSCNTSCQHFCSSHMPVTISVPWMVNVFHTSCFFCNRCIYQFLNVASILQIPCVQPLWLCYKVNTLVWTHPSLHTKKYKLTISVSFIQPFSINMSFPHDKLTLCAHLHEMCCYCMKIFTWDITYIISKNTVCFYLVTPYWHLLTLQIC